METISIIMPCYNAGEYIAESVASALGQTYREIELLVVDDGSSDNSLEVIENVRDTRLRIISQPHRGVCAARNKALEAARGSYVAFLDADDLWRPDCIEIMYSALQDQPDAMLAYCGWQNIGLPGGQGEPFLPPDYECLEKIHHLLVECPWPIHAALTRVTAIEEVGGFDERFQTSEDYGLWLRIAARHKITRVAEVLAYYRHHDGTQATKNKALAARNNLLIKRDFLRQNPDIARRLGRRRVREITHGELLSRGYRCYWNRDLEAARQIFRMTMKTGYGTISDWKYMLPSLLPLSLHQVLINLLNQNKRSNT